MQYALYVPLDPQLGVDHASAIVGKTLDDGRIHIYYEGNRFNASNLKLYAERARSAAGRIHARYPTIAQAIARPDQLLRVGTYDTTEWVIADLDPEHIPALQAWLTPEPVPAPTLPEALKFVLYRHAVPAVPQSVAFWGGRDWVAHWTDAAMFTRAEVAALREQAPSFQDTKTLRFHVVEGREPVHVPE